MQRMRPPPPPIGLDPRPGAQRGRQQVSAPALSGPPTARRGAALPFATRAPQVSSALRGSSPGCTAEQAQWGSLPEPRPPPPPLPAHESPSRARNSPSRRGSWPAPASWPRPSLAACPRLPSGPLVSCCWRRPREKVAVEAVDGKKRRSGDREAARPRPPLVPAGSPAPPPPPPPPPPASLSPFSFLSLPPSLLPLRPLSSPTPGQ
ncbi:WAS/WASL-interacting protein family member 1-like [Eublepharis macularius]|uniref:WAS/WASL-interacting protein family member 1-like n=1 Tax=Eublepharis macularius TaxID=481883 RepID=A0AA97JJC4_EUBMA|nr:WAS/WASL-interacting protein family member 1-like [Eublepharis macularius]